MFRNKLIHLVFIVHIAFVFINQTTAQDSLFIEKEIRDLAKEITTHDSTSYQKALSIYNWVTSNVMYDVRKYKAGSSKKQDALTVLETGKATCLGYSNLYEQLALSQGLETKIIAGYTKGLDYFPNQKVRWAEHVWNVVKINSNWYHVDATFGSGTLELSKNIVTKITDAVVFYNFPPTSLRFIPEVSMAFFAPSIPELLKTHLPADPIWQLSKCPLSITSYGFDSLQNMPTECNANYSDTLHSYNRLSELNQKITSAQRTLSYNPLNHKLLADTYNEYGHYLLERANTTANINDSLKNEKYEDALAVLKLSYAMYGSVKREIKQEQKELLRYLKTYNKVITRSAKKQYKSNDKFIERNNKTISKNAVKRKKLEKQIKKLQALNSVILADDKIYDVKTPPRGATVNIEQVSAHKASINKNSKLVNHLIDSIHLIDAEYQKQNTLNKEAIVYSHLQISENNLNLLKIAQQLIALNNVNQMDTIQSIFSEIKNNADSSYSLKKQIKLNESIISKDNAKSLKEYQNRVKSLTKENKKTLIEIKKIKSASNDEEILYAIENQKLIDINKELINRYKQESQKIKDLKQILQDEKKLLKQQNKGIKQINFTQKSVNKHRVKLVVSRNKLRRNNNKQNSDYLKNSISLCTEFMKQLNF